MKRIHTDFASVIAFRVDDESLIKILVYEIGCFHIGCDSYCEFIEKCIE